MDEGSDSRLWSILKRFFSRKGECHLEEAILEAKDDGELQNDEMSMLLNVLQLDDKQAYEIMVPRTDIVCAEIDESVTEVAKKIFQSGHSRLPIYKETKDQIVGILHCKELLRFFVGDDKAPADLSSVLRSPYFIPETKNVKNILLDFQSNKQHMAIVLDEYGGTAGLVTLEDVLEEIVGDIEDEYDPPRPEDIQPMDQDTFLVSGRTSLEDLEECGIRLESEQVETVGGYISEQLGRVPEPNETLELQGYSFLIKEADVKQIQWVLVSKLAS